MSIPILIIGKSGAGKSASMRNLDPEKTAVINVLGKPMPFKNKLKTLKTDDYKTVLSAITKAKMPVIVLDDAGYLITNAFMRGHSATGGGSSVYSLYNQLADNFWCLIQSIAELPNDKRVYVIMHEDESDTGAVKPKTIGKLLDDKVCVEGMFTICLRCMIRDDKRVFATQTSGLDVAKSPMGMFDSVYIDNDLAAVDKAICEYYDIKEGTTNE